MQLNVIIYYVKLFPTTERFRSQQILVKMAINPFLSIYKKDYPPKKPKRYEWTKTAQEFQDPMGESFKTYLQLSNDPNPRTAPTQDADSYWEKHCKEYPKHKQLHLPKPVDNTTMKKIFIYDGRTGYQIDYCDLQKDEEYKEDLRKKNMFRLPEDCYIPMTTYTYNFRKPIMINSRCYEKVARCKAPNNLEPNHKLREILKTSTGKSEYGNVISDLGDVIMDEELHGKIVPL